MGRKIVTKVTAEKGYLNAKMVHGWWMTTEELHSTNSVIVAIERTKNRAAATAEGLICVSGWRANNEVDAHNKIRRFSTREEYSNAHSPPQFRSSSIQQVYASQPNNDYERCSLAESALCWRGGVAKTQKKQGGYFFLLPQRPQQITSFKRKPVRFAWPKF